MILGHGGNKQQLADRLGCPTDEIIDMSSNLNPLGPPEMIHGLIREKIHSIHALPEPAGDAMAKGFARYHGIDPGLVIPGNGTTFFIYTLPMALNPEKVLILGPTYSDYQDACAMHGIEYSLSPAKKESGFHPDLDLVSAQAAQADLVFVCNPNNPTGALIQKQDLLALIKAHTGTCFVVDESYLPFVDDADALSFVKDTEIANLLVLSSMSKIFRIPGLRTGFLSGAKPLVDKVMAYYQPWSVNALAQEVIQKIFSRPQEIDPFYQKTRDYIKEEKAKFIAALANVPGIRVFDSPTYFVLAELETMTAKLFCDLVGEDRILIRDCGNFQGLSERFVRFSLKTESINQALVSSIKKALTHD
ncbi:MAG: pyridoxal phosphate-dependent class II aminotransferase [Desulfobacter sp.]|nr:pyridoxal phosphate-dependent class II aminotransferase [Desulfobacter sp.]WDP84119.1 MAG: pyridoxal phosphate-dependent class II aminotransferase [Desulfobacter sp.]